MQIREYLKTKKILTDGSFGTYFSTKYNSDELPESMNTEKPEMVREIHAEYIDAGAVLLRTNTFASNMNSLKTDLKGLEKNIKSACRIALGEAEKAKKTGKEIFVAGDIGPIASAFRTSDESPAEEYKKIAGFFLEEEIDIFVFETFADVDDILETAAYIKSKNKESFIIAQFCVNQHGYTSLGLNGQKLAQKASGSGLIDACGFNCGIGPSSMENMIMDSQIGSGCYITAVPNAGFPASGAEKPIFRNNIDYFAERMIKIAKKVDIIGGCCGTSPLYIKKLHEKISLEQKSKDRGASSDINESRKDSSAAVNDLKNVFWEKDSAKKIFAIELAPPFGADDVKMMDSANTAAELKADIITIPDSPSGRTRADSCLMGAKIMNDTGIRTMPHICCRDKNMIALRSEILGAYLNGIRNLLIITGDPVPTLMRQTVKGVFPFDSTGLMKVISEMNEEEFKNDKIVFGGAINQGRKNIEVEKKRILKKIECGARFFISQPVFSDMEKERLREINKMIKAIDKEIKLICGVMPLVSRKNALFMKNEMPGINVTDEIIEMFKENGTREEGEESGIKIAKKVIEDTSDFADGYYFSVPFNRLYLLNHILE